MPEGPELHLASVFINHVCKGRVFGRVHMSAISKCPVVYPEFPNFTISAVARGKELKVTLTELVELKVPQTQKPRLLDILFTFGLVGKFNFLDATEELQKHAHLNFFTSDSGPKQVLSFIDYMRFGKWTPNTDFSFKERGPCVLMEYQEFRNNVLKNIESSVFNKPICEVLLNQKYFNGIGNYLRAEILHRAKVPPFVTARSVLEPLVNQDVKTEQPDVLQLCSLLPNQVVQLEGSWYDGGDRESDTNAFNNWLQCYYQDGMKNIADHNKRTIWYSGPLGPLAPKDVQVRGKKRSKKKKKTEEEVTTQSDSETASKTKGRKRSKKADNKTVPLTTKKRKKEPKETEEIEKKKNIKEEKADIIRNGTDADDKRLKGNGRLTRKKMQEIVEEINSACEKKVKSRKSSAAPKKRKVEGDVENGIKQDKTDILNGIIDKKDPEKGAKKRKTTEIANGRSEKDPKKVDQAKDGKKSAEKKPKQPKRDKKTPLNNDAVYLKSSRKASN